MSLTMSSFSSGYRYVKNLFGAHSQTAPAAVESQTHTLPSVATSFSVLNKARSKTPVASSVDKHAAFDFEVNPAAAKLEISAPQLVITTSSQALNTKLEIIKDQQAKVIDLLNRVISLKDQSRELNKKQGQQESELMTRRISLQLKARDKVDGLKELVTEKIPVRKSSSSKRSIEVKSSFSITKETQDLADKFYASLFKEHKLPASQFPLFKECCEQFSDACLFIASIAMENETTDGEQFKLKKQKEVITTLQQELDVEEVILINKQIALFNQETQAKNQILTAQNPTNTLENTHSLDAIEKRLESYAILIKEFQNHLGLSAEQEIGTSATQPATKTLGDTEHGAALPVLNAPTHHATQPPLPSNSAALPARHLRKVGSMPDIWGAAQAQPGAMHKRFIPKHKTSQSVSFSRGDETGLSFMQSTAYQGFNNPASLRSPSPTASTSSPYLDEQKQKRTKPTTSEAIRSINTSIDQLIEEVKTDRASSSTSLQSAAVEKEMNTPYVTPLNIPPKSRLVKRPASGDQEMQVFSPTFSISEGQAALSSPISPTFGGQESRSLRRTPSIAKRPHARAERQEVAKRPKLPSRSYKRLSQASTLSSINEHDDFKSPIAQAGRRSKEIEHA